MISINATEYIKYISELHADNILGGVIYCISEDGKFTWRKASKVFDLELFQVGDKVNSEGIAMKAVREKRTLKEDVPRSIYGMRLTTIAEPLINDEGEVVGVFSIIFPRLHPVASAFNHFAPKLVSMFSEGSFMYVTDLEKAICRQGSDKFDIPDLQVGVQITSDLISYKVIKEQKIISQEVDSSKYGVAALITGSPLYDEETGKIVGTSVLAVPKVVASNLRDMSGGLESGIAQVASAIEEVAASASNIYENEQKLNEEINEISNLSEEINKISAYIKEIADQTKMLGLNAAIEAARAGETGKGFGVVATEIRKLSEQSKSTVPEINKITDRIKKKVETANEMSKSSLLSSQEQAAATEEITASIEEISATSEELNKIAKNL